MVNLRIHNKIISSKFISLKFDITEDIHPNRFVCISRVNEQMYKKKEINKYNFTFENVIVCSNLFH